jgi:hypothetical protein
MYLMNTLRGLIGRGPNRAVRRMATLNSYAVLSGRSSNLSGGMATLHP